MSEHPNRQLTDKDRETVLARINAMQPGAGRDFYMEMYDANNFSFLDPDLNFIGVDRVKMRQKLAPFAPKGPQTLDEKLAAPLSDPKQAAADAIKDRLFGPGWRELEGRSVD